MSCFSCFTFNEKSRVHDKDGGPDLGAQPHDRESPPMHPRLLDKSPQVDKEVEFVREAHKNNIEAQIFNFRELAAATKNFRQETLLGEGGFGRVYKGHLAKQGQTVAVKQLDRNGMQGNKEFMVEVLMLSLMHHQNLVNLIGYCADGDQRLLVYEYMPLGSLEDHIFDIEPEGTPLNWLTRLKIALGAAKGLEYLHSAKPPVIFRDMKSSNILLDKDYNPKLSDFGLAKLGPQGEKTHVSSRVMGTYGYCAPEYQRTGHLTLKSDIYSYGVVLLELITGRRAIDPTKPNNEQNLVSWAEPYFRDPSKFPLLADPLIEDDIPTKALNQMVAIAAMCLQGEASVRPLITDVVTALSFLGQGQEKQAAVPVPAQPDSDRSAQQVSEQAPILIPPKPAEAPTYDVSHPQSTPVSSLSKVASSPAQARPAKAPVSVLSLPKGALAQPAAQPKPQPAQTQPALSKSVSAQVPASTHSQPASLRTLSVRCGPQAAAQHKPQPAQASVSSATIQADSVVSPLKVDQAPSSAVASPQKASLRSLSIRSAPQAAAQSKPQLAQASESSTTTTTQTDSVVSPPEVDQDPSSAVASPQKASRRSLSVHSPAKTASDKSLSVRSLTVRSQAKAAQNPATAQALPQSVHDSTSTSQPALVESRLKETQASTTTQPASDVTLPKETKAPSQPAAMPKTQSDSVESRTKVDQLDKATVSSSPKNVSVVSHPKVDQASAKTQSTSVESRPKMDQLDKATVSSLPKHVSVVSHPKVDQASTKKQSASVESRPKVDQLNKATVSASPKHVSVVSHPKVDQASTNTQSASVESSPKVHQVPTSSVASPKLGQATISTPSQTLQL